MSKEKNQVNALVTESIDLLVLLKHDRSFNENIDTLKEVHKLLNDLKHKSTNENIVYVYTDGSCINNGNKNEKKKGGCGVYIKCMDIEKRLSFNLADPNEERTNNKCELYAAEKAFAYLIQMNFKNKQIYWISDSQYTINSIVRWFDSWRKNNFKNTKNEPVKNIEYIKRAEALYQILLRRKNEIKPIFVKSHNKEKSIWNEGNNIADQLALEAANNDHLSDDHLSNEIID